MAVSVLGHTLLGLLAREPASGLDLTHALQQRIAFFWHARHSQVYPELARLEKDGLVVHTVVPQRDRPDKKVYALTERGRQILLGWLLAPTDPPQIRDEFLVKVTSFWLIEPERAIDLLLDQARQHEERLAMLTGIERGMQADFQAALADPSAPPFMTYLTLQRGLSYEREYAAWCRWAAEYLRQHQRPDRDAGA
ncbi:MAG TPA: PadR family transcriptional regulator [Chloroflexota bacterium]|nr:PadR family transcriptional regulator [Chloroflexota bacterium]